MVYTLTHKFCPFLHSRQHVVGIIRKGNMFFIGSLSETFSVIFQMHPAGIFIDMSKTHTLDSVTCTTW